MNSVVINWIRKRVMIWEYNPNDTVIKQKSGTINDFTLYVYPFLEQNELANYVGEKNGWRYYEINEYGVEYMKAFVEL